MRKILGKGRIEVSTAMETSNATKSDEAERTSTTTASVEPTLESWIDWIKRVTDEVEEIAAAVGVKNWVEEQRRRKWRWAGYVARRLDNRWTNRLLHWTPVGARKQGRPRKRWSDDFHIFLNATCHNTSQAAYDWLQVATNTTTWRELQSQHYNTKIETHKLLMELKMPSEIKMCISISSPAFLSAFSSFAVLD